MYFFCISQLIRKYSPTLIKLVFTITYKKALTKILQTLVSNCKNELQSGLKKNAYKIAKFLVRYFYRSCVLYSCYISFTYSALIYNDINLISFLQRMK